VLETALSEYSGTLLVISHDRSFINALATRVVEVRRGHLREFPGNYDDYLRDAGNTVSAEGGSIPGHGRRARAPNDRRETQRLERERKRRRDRLARQVERVEAEILEREGELEQLRWRRGDPSIHRDAERARALIAEMGIVEEAVKQLYRRWESLATELEELDAEPEGSEG
jgi:ATP-binding cassette subfamily F protein 3